MIPIPRPLFHIRHPDRSEQRSRSGRTSDSFAPAKPVPVPSLRIQKSVILSPVEESEPVLSILEGRSDAATFLFQSSPAPLCDCLLPNSLARCRDVPLAHGSRRGTNVRRNCP